MYEKAHQYPKVLKWTEIWLLPDQVLDPARLPFEHNSTDKSCSCEKHTKFVLYVGTMKFSIQNE
jgi:hypothetical protein